MKMISLFTALAVMIGLFANAGRKLFQWLGPLFPNIGPLAYGIAYGLAVTGILGAFIVSRVPNTGALAPVFYVCHYLLGFLVYMVMLVNLAGLLLFLGGLFRLLPAPLPSRAGIAAGAIPLFLSAALSVYGAVHGAVIQIKPYEIQIGSRTEEAPFRMALLSDLHLGYVVGGHHLEKVVDAVNSTKPDLVCIAGDIFDGDATALSDPEALKDLLLKIDSVYGVYACLGNHDAGPSYEQMLGFLSEAGVRVLQDEAVVIDGRFVLAGRKDSFPIGGQGERRGKLALPAGAEGLPVIVMDHQPGNIRDYGEETELILCGHTHQGQMFPFNLITDAIFDVDYGYYRASGDSPQVIVTSGAGTWGPPQRVATDNEVAEILLFLPAGQ